MRSSRVRVCGLRRGSSPPGRSVPWLHSQPQTAYRACSGAQGRGAQTRKRRPTRSRPRCRLARRPRSRRRQAPRCLPATSPSRGRYFGDAPSGIRTRATTLKGWRPRPLVDGGGRHQNSREPRLHWPGGPVAQLVEQGTFNPKVAGSIPARPITERDPPAPRA